MWSAPAPRRGQRSWWLPILLWLASINAWAQAPTYCNSNLGAYCGTGNANISGVAIANTSLNNPNTTCNTANGSGYTLWPAAGTTTGTMNPGATYSVSVTTAEAGIISVWFDWNQNGSFEASEWTQVTTASTANTASSVNVTVPTNATLGQTGMRVRSRLTSNANGAGDACLLFGSGETEDYIVTIAPAAACTGTPTAGTTVVSSTSICAPAPISLSLQGASFGTGLTYQWQSSTNGGTTWTNISGATNSTFVTTPVAVTTQFRAVLTCSGQSANSTPATVTVNAPTYATLPYAQNFDNAWVDVCATREVPSNNWRMTPSATDPDASWRRDDDGAAASWTSPTFGAYSPTSSQGTNSARFHSSYASSGTIGLLDLYANLPAGNKILTFDYINVNGTDSLTVHVSTDGGATFGPAILRLNTAATWTPQSITFTSTSATAIIRFRARGDFGSTDIGIDNLNLNVLAACSGTPTAGTTTVNRTSICTPTAVTLGLTGSSVATGLTYQWQSSTNGGTTWTNISGATSSTFVTAPVAVTTQFRAVVTCSNGQSANSTPATVTVNAPTYATLPYTEGFDNTWVDACSTRDIPNNNWRMTASATDPDASWRRDDDGASAGWTSPTYGIYSPTFTNGTNSARFHSGYASSGTIGLLDLYANLPAGTKILTFDYININGTDSLTVHVSTDGGATFGPALLRLNTASAWTPQTVTFGATSATSVIRFRARGDFGSSDIGIDNLSLSVLPVCSGTPTAGTTTVSRTSICAPTAVTLGLTGSSVASGLTYQWQSSTNGTTWTNINGATTPTYTTAPLTASTFFRAVVSCTGGQSANSTPVQVLYSAPTYASLPALENFDNTWVDACGTRDVPTNNWRSTPSPADVDASWRRDDDGTAGGWTGPTLGAYTPTSSQGTNSARFHSYNANNGTVGTLDYYINMSQAGSKRLTFDFINTSGTDSLTVHLSTDGGVTFGPALLRLNTAATWANQALLITSTSATSVIRFRGRGDFGVTDIGLDNVRVESTSGCLSPAGLTVTATTTTTASLSWVAGGTGTYTIEYGPVGFTPGTGTSVPNITGTTYTLTNLTPGTPYQFYVTQNCGGTVSAAGGPIVFNTQITNDDPTGAITLTVGTSCTPVAGTNVGATTTTANGYTNPGTNPNNCGTASAPKDVWFKFTTAATGPTSTAVRITVTGTPASQLRAFSATSAAGPFTQIGCAATSSTAVAPNLDLTTLTPSTTYYVRVSGYGSTDPQGPFTICASLLPNCQDPVTPAAGIITSTTVTLSWGGVQTTGSTYEIQYGPQPLTLGQGTTLTGIAGQTTTLSNLTSSTNYCFYVRQNCGSVNGFSAWVGPICFTTAVGVPLNDEPCGAVSLAVNGSGQLTQTNGTNVGATTTQSQTGIILPACSPANAPSDVWYRVTVPAGQTSLNVALSGTAAGMIRLYTAASCSTGFNLVQCRSASGPNVGVGSQVFTGLTAGTTYYIAISGYGTNDTRGAFVIGDVTTSTAKQLAGGQVSIFPNPASGGVELNLRVSGAKSGALQYDMLNALGQVVLSRSVEVRNGNLDQTINTAGLAKGLYQVRLRIGNEVLVQKVVID